MGGQRTRGGADRGAQTAEGQSEGRGDSGHRWGGGEWIRSAEDEVTRRWVRYWV